MCLYFLSNFRWQLQHLCNSKYLLIVVGESSWLICINMYQHCIPLLVQTGGVLSKILNQTYHTPEGMWCHDPHHSQDGMHAIVAQGGSQSKLIHFAYITPIGPTKIRQLVDASKLILKKYLKKKTNKQKVSSQLIFCFLSKKNKSNFGQRKLTLAIFHLSNFLPLSLRPKMSLTISLPCPGGGPLSKVCKTSWWQWC